MAYLQLELVELVELQVEYNQTPEYIVHSTHVVLST